MADVLFISHRIPYPPDRGDKIRSWHILKRIAQLTNVHVAALVDEEKDWQYQSVLEDIAATVILEPRNLSKPRAALSGLMTGSPASVRAFSNAALGRRINRILSTRPISTIFVYSGQMAQYVPHDIGQCRFVMDFVDMDSAKFAAYSEQGSGVSAWAMRQEAARLYRFERETAQRADVNLFVSEAEAKLFRDHSGLSESKVQALENGIDLEHFAPGLKYDPVFEGEAQLIVFTGQMDYRPNIDAVSAFARETMPIIRQSVPEAVFAIVGRAPTAEVAALASLPGILVTGEVADTRGWLAQAKVVVAPLKLARGIQNKVLEAMAMSKAVVVSPAAAEGIDAVRGQEFIVANAPQDESAAIVHLIKNPVEAAIIGAAARLRMEARYGWDARLSDLPSLLDIDEKLGVAA